ncbi:MAG TPA: hypothetical protein VGN98_17210, partial [Tianweitania sediminis]|nr:hypothetical protein [Tianweitania sediminis]
HRAFDEYERVAKERGLPDGIAPARAALMKEVGYSEAQRAMSVELSRAVRLMKAIHRRPAPVTIQGIAVKLEAVTFDQSDFSVDFTNWTTDVAEEQLLKLSRQVSKLARSIS